MGNKALWKKTLVEARALLAACTLLMFVFNWLYVWVSSQVKLGALQEFIASLPEGFQNLSGVPVQDVATVAGRIALGYVDPVILVATAVWGIARGSDVVSGELNRGTMEMLLAQPLRRISVLVVHAIVTLGGAAIIALAAFLGTAAGLATVTLERPVETWLFIAPAVNVFAMGSYVAAIATLVSACDRYRWRTVGLVGGYYVLSMICEVLGKMVEWLGWLRYFTFLAAFEPQPMVSHPERAWQLSLEHNGVLLGLAAVAYVVAAVVFCRRDLPAPL